MAGDKNLSDNTPTAVEEKLVAENPDQAIAPPYLKLQQEPIPNPELAKKNN